MCAKCSTVLIDIFPRLGAGRSGPFFLYRKVYVIFAHTPNFCLYICFINSFCFIVWPFIFVDYWIFGVVNTLHSSHCATRINLFRRSLQQDWNQKLWRETTNDLISCYLWHYKPLWFNNSLQGQYSIFFALWKS